MAANRGGLLVPGVTSHAVDSLIEAERDWGGHLLLVHRNERERRALVSAWVEDGLRRDAKVVYVQPGGLPRESGLSAVLEAHPVSLAHRAFGGGQLQVIEPGLELCTAAGQRQLLDQALAEGYSSLWLSGESGESDRDAPAVRQRLRDEAESVLDLLCRAGRVSALCQYPADLSVDRLDGAVALHAGGLLASGVEGRADGDEIRLGGEIDLAGADALASWLRAALREFRGGLGVLDLSRLRFLDVAGFRSIQQGSADHRASGGRLLLRGAPGTVLAVLALLVADPGIEVEW